MSNSIDEGVAQLKTQVADFATTTGRDKAAMLKTSLFQYNGFNSNDGNIQKILNSMETTEFPAIASTTCSPATANPTASPPTDCTPSMCTITARSVGTPAPASVDININNIQAVSGGLSPAPAPAGQIDCVIPDDYTIPTPSPT